MDIRRVSVLSEPATVQEIADNYRIAYGHEPWKEGFICPVCRYTVALNAKHQICPKCLEMEKLIVMVDRWPVSSVVTDFYRENQTAGSICLVAEEDNKIRGFAWGYPITMSVSAGLKLDAPGLEDIVDGNIFYLDECAVLPKYQKLGIGTMLVREIFARHPYSKLILRTLADSPMQKLIERLGGRKIMSISENRIIMLHAREGSRQPNYLTLS